MGCDNSLRTIEGKIEKISSHLRICNSPLETFGTWYVSFDCPDCNQNNNVELVYNGEILSKTVSCEKCNKDYQITPLIDVKILIKELEIKK
jgi:hypothetical protein